MSPPKRTARSHIPLEWKTDVITTSDNTVTTGEFDLDLLPDEIAEIVKIDSGMETFVALAASDLVKLKMYISMDPDANDDPETNATLEDLEVFYNHSASFQGDYAEATESGGLGVKVSDYKVSDFAQYPVLVGTNFAQVVKGDANNASEFRTTVYFKRRKANAMELNQILLKRR